MTREHLGLSLFLNVPFVIVLSKVDIAPENVHSETLDFLKKLIKSSRINRTPVIINEQTKLEEIEQYADVLHGNKLVPIFQVSSVTSLGLEGLRHFIAHVKNRDMLIKAYDKEAPFQYDIQEHFQVNGVGIVVSGLVRSGMAKVG
jgi:GTPase